MIKKPRIRKNIQLASNDIELIISYVELQNKIRHLNDKNEDIFCEIDTQVEIANILVGKLAEYTNIGRKYYER